VSRKSDEGIHQEGIAKRKEGKHER